MEHNCVPKMYMLQCFFTVAADGQIDPNICTECGRFIKCLDTFYTYLNSFEKCLNKEGWPNGTGEIQGKNPKQKLTHCRF